MSDYTPVKRCSKCGDEKPATLEFFYKHKDTADRLGSWCRSCINESAREKRKADPEKARNRDKARREATRETRREVSRNYVKNNPDSRKETIKRYYAKKREAILEYKRTYAKKNRLKYRAYDLKRRALEAEASGHHSGADIKRQYEGQKGRCWWCEMPVGDNYHVDHLIPLSRGGSNGPENIVITCPFCNLSKNDRLPSEWIGRLL